MKLYFAPGACSLSPHLALREAGLAFDLEKVAIHGDKKTEHGEDYLSVNPKGSVPALRLDDGSVLTEGPAIVQYIADLKPDAKLAPPNGTIGRYRLQEALNFISSEVHKAFGALFDKQSSADAKAQAKANLKKRFDYLEGQMKGRTWLVGDGFTVADGYLFVMLGWAPRMGLDLDRWPSLEALHERVGARPAVRAALAAEGSPAGAEPVHVPFVEILKSIPGVFGIRLEAEPKYDVVDRVGEVEIRRYAPALVAEVSAAGAHDEAVAAAFDRLGRYIFGDNAKRAELPMTAPVFQREGQRLPMTAPVTQRPDGGGWSLAFFLSNTLAPEEAPRPNDPGIELARAPERLVAALRYRGNNTDEKRHDARAELLAALAGHPKYAVDGGVYWAQYDGPFVLPFVKKNEAQVELSQRA
jgi:glutathione S-transferase